MTDTTPKKQVPGRPFVKGQVANPKGTNRYTKELANADDVFLDEFFREVEALQGSQVIKASQYKLFIHQMVQAGIKGNTPAKKLVLQHFATVEARKAQKAEAKDNGVVEIDWDEEKARVLQEVKAAAKAAKEALRGK